MAGAGNGTVRAAVVLLGMALLCGCAAPGQEVKPDQPEPPFSVRLPLLETKDMDVRAEPPAVQPELALPPPHPSASGVEEGNARSLRMLEIHHGGGKSSRPPAGTPAEPDEKP